MVKYYQSINIGGQHRGEILPKPFNITMYNNV